MNRIYCTYFDQRYLARGLVMLRSLRARDPGAAIVALCFDDVTARIVAAAEDIRASALPAAALHARDRDLAALPGPRTRWEVYASHKAAFMLAVLQDAAADTTVAFVDADTWFFAAPAPVFAEFGAASIGLSPHRFAAEKGFLARYGRFNAGFVVVRNDATGRRCIADWRADCLAWCHETVMPDGRFMNQGYLDAWPDRYPGVHVIDHPGANLGPWNIERFALDADESGVSVDGQPLVFYHFSGVMRDEQGAWWSTYPIASTVLALARAHVYRPYVTAIVAEERRLMAAHGVGAIGSARLQKIGPTAVRLADPVPV